MVVVIYITTTINIKLLHGILIVLEDLLMSLHGDLCRLSVERWASTRHYTAGPTLLASGNLFKYHEEVLYWQPLIPPERFDICFPPNRGVLRRSRCV